MLRKVQLRAALLVLGSTAMLNACAESDGDIAQPNTATRVSALVADFSVAPGTQTINEGGSATIDVGRLCVDGTADVTITVDWADGSPTDSRTFTSANFGTGASCSSPGFKEVCGGDSTATNCGNWTHTYADNGNYTVQFEGKQGTDTTTQAVSVVVNNLAPNVTLLRTGPRFEGVNGAFDLTVEDPGLLATEIAGVTWTWTPASGVNDPTVVNCTCANATDCDDGTNLDICTESNGPESDTKSRIYLDNGTYTLTVVVTDKDGAQTTRSTTTIIDNTAPGNLNVKINNVDVSTDNANPTVLVEGTAVCLRGHARRARHRHADVQLELG
ncbi:MAG: hypothetical protein R3E66_07195 [bacterium]